MFLAGVAERLGLAPEHIFAAYEDAFYYLWRERQLPSNVDPFKSKLKDPMERARLARVFERGLDSVIGHVLPVARAASGRWRTGPWFLRRDRCYLVPGDSPVGYRLPLDSQPWVKESDYPYMHEPDPMSPPRALPRAADIRRQFFGDARDGDADYGAGRSSAAGGRGTGKVARPRDGVVAPASAPGIPAVFSRYHAYRHVRRAQERHSLYIHAAHR